MGQAPIQASGSGRGIVICAGGQRYFTGAFVVTSILRRALGSDLPIEIWHRGGDEIDAAMTDLVESLGARVRVLAGCEDARGLTPDLLRLLALRASAFSQILSLDADTAPLQDPAAAFDWPAFQATGLFFFPERESIDEKDPGRTIAGLTAEPVMRDDPGLALIDRTRHAALLDLAVSIAAETARTAAPDGSRRAGALALAALATGVVPGRPEARPVEHEGEPLHHDPAGAPFVQHRRAAKWRFAGPNRPTPLDTATAAAEAGLSALREGWSGRVFHAPARSETARQLEAALIRTSAFRYRVDAGDWRPFHLHAGGRIGLGRGAMEMHWAVIDGEAGPVLEFYSDVRCKVRLFPQADGVWDGACDGPPGFAARLEPAGAASPSAGTEG